MGRAVVSIVQSASGMRALWVSMPVMVACLAASARADTAGDPASEPGAAGEADAVNAAAAVDVSAVAAAAGAPGAAGAEEAAGATARREAAALARARRDGTSEDAGYAGAPIAVSVSSPVGWLRDTFGASVYVAPGAHSVIRANFSRYDAESLLLSLLANFENAPHHGTITDLGIGWSWYPRRPWDGFLLELGVNRRERDTWVHSEIEDRVDTTSTTYAGRALIGWSWMLNRRMFLAIAVGASAGREKGRDKITPEFPREMPTTQAVDRTQVDFESYWRLGVVFGR